MKGLMEAPVGVAPPMEARVDAAKPRYTTGAIGAVSQQIADLKARSVQEIDPDLIDLGGLQDRLDQSGVEALAASIHTYGQQVPVLVRPSPDRPERFQVVYGRRRVAALKALGQPVKAMVRALDDQALVLAQGQENTARKDLSFIEKANFARQMRDASYDRQIICDALHVDKTVVSRMLSIVDRLPLTLIEAIGAAPSVGRDRWLALANAAEGRDPSDAALGETSDARFEAVMAALRSPPKPPALSEPVTTHDGAPLAEVKRTGGATVIKLTKEQDAGFHDWLVANLARLHSDWRQKK